MFARLRGRFRPVLAQYLTSPSKASTSGKDEPSTNKRLTAAASPCRPFGEYRERTRKIAKLIGRDVAGFVEIERLLIKVGESGALRKLPRHRRERDAQWQCPGLFSRDHVEHSAPCRKRQCSGTNENLLLCATLFIKLLRRPPVFSNRRVDEFCCGEKCL